MARGLVKVQRVEGLSETEKALATLSKSVGRNVLRRVLMKGGVPIRDKMAALAPRDTAELSESIAISTKVQNNVGKAEFAAAMAAGLGQEAAVGALRSARRAAKGTGSFAEVFVGPTKAENKQDAVKRIVQEFGSINQPAQPYARPAWESEQQAALDIIKNEMGGEIKKAVDRSAKRAARLAAKKVA